jgi:hypothetical protein
MKSQVRRGQIVRAERIVVDFLDLKFIERIRDVWRTSFDTKVRGFPMRT